MKRFRLIALTKKGTKKSSTDVFLLFALTKNNLIKHSKLRKEKYKSYDSKIRGEFENEMDLNPVFKEIN